jgi:DNA-binding NtrC family response regulator
MERSRSILIVDDDEGVCDLLVWEFARRGWAPTFAVDGEAAWARLREHPVDVVVSDVRMPAGDGLTLLARARTLAERPVFVLLTAYGPLCEPAADGQLGKPFSVEELVALVDRCLTERAFAPAEWW